VLRAPGWRNNHQQTLDFRNALRQYYKFLKIKTFSVEFSFLGLE
jgi:hypothetical protein